jgi:hypothetical protein
MSGAMAVLMNNVAGGSGAPVYSPLAGSLEFNGSTQSLGISPGCVLSTTAYTIEGWFLPTGPTDYALQMGLVGTDQSGALSLFNNDAQSFTLDRFGGGGARTYTFPTDTLVGTWQYIILNRNSDQRETMWVGTFVNTSSYVTCNRAISAAGGSSISGGTQINNLDYSGPCNLIGQFYSGNWYGYITNLRITVGAAWYDSNSSTVIAPTAPLTSSGFGSGPIQYLMLGADIITDSSGYNTVTNNNGVTQTGDVPF